MVQRHFVGWPPASLDRVVEILWGRADAGAWCDLSDLVVAVPGRRAGRMLLALLAERASARGVGLSPPLMVTPGELRDLLTRDEGEAGSLPPAGPGLRRLAWIEALRARRESLGDGALGYVPEAGDVAGWTRLAVLLERAQSDLAGIGLLFDDVVETATEGLDGDVARRWQVFGDVQRDAGSILKRWGTCDPDTQGIAWMQGANRRGVLARPVVLVGVSELTGVTRAALGEVAEAEAIVLAPEGFAEGFDSLGCVRPAFWADRAIDIDDEAILFASAPQQQAGCVLESLAATWNASQSEVVVGLGDESLTRHIRRCCELHGGLGVHDAAGIRVEATSPYRLLRCVHELLLSPTFESLSSLVRHPDCERWLSAHLGTGTAWLLVMDEYQKAHVQGDLELRPGRPRWGETRKKERQVLDGVWEGVVELLGELAPARRARLDSVSHWASACVDLLRRVYADREFLPERESDRRTLEACRQIGRLLESRAWRTEGDRGNVAEMTGADALGLVLGLAGERSVAEDPRDDAVDMVGWLELLLDPSPAVVVAGVNEGSIPSAMGADPLLPQPLRRALGLPDEMQRLARDAYVLTSLVEGRESCTLICGRRGEDGTPLLPSRLLFRCDDGALRRRVEAWCHDEEVVNGAGAPGPAIRPPLQEFGTRDQFVPAIHVEPRRVVSMRVTGFSVYLRSPYEFYLTQVLGLDSHEERRHELAATGFGQLLHLAVEDFGRSESRDSADVDVVRGVLEESLDARARRLFGKRPQAGVALQLEEMRRRLSELAVWQVAWRGRGWKIDRVEWKVPAGLGVEVDGEMMELRGKVDRIDRNERTGAWAILDYKSSKQAKRPERTHQRGDGWVDLQLPLYRHLFRQVESDAEVTLGYVALSSALRQHGAGERETSGQADPFLMANWDEDAMSSAMECAADVVRGVRRGEFGELARPRAGDGPLGALCHQGIVVPAAVAEGES